MALSEQEAQEIKKQLLTQIEKFPPEQKEAAKKEIESMSIKQLEEFLVKNNLVKSKESQQLDKEPTQCVFCSIIQGKIPTYKLDENKQAIASLEINPISQGHSIIIPRQHTTVEKIPNQAFTLAKKIAKKLKTKLKPKDIQIQPSTFMGHSIINILPIYDNEDLNSERKKADEKQLKQLQEKLKTKPHQPRIKKTPEEKFSSLPEFPRRIP
ncbi:MAG: HIT domain-containing protein [Nanoarchaeota archaeon]|nr:HIT domain-containing protein [Nanoarchaeota archaeon]